MRSPRNAWVTTLSPRPTSSWIGRSLWPAPPERAWPWLLQLGKHRAGWYLPRSLERFIPRSRRPARTFVAIWRHLEVGDILPDYGGKNESFQVAILQPPSALV